MSQGGEAFKTPRQSLLHVLSWTAPLKAVFALWVIGITSTMPPAAKAGEPEFTLANPTFASGGGAVSCQSFNLTFTIGEAVVGSVAEGEWRMVTGFPATLPDPPPQQVSIFQDGFELAVATNVVVKGGCAP